MKKKKISKEAKKLGKFNKRRPTLINSSESYQFHTPNRETSNEVEKKEEHFKGLAITDKLITEYQSRT